MNKPRADAQLVSRINSSWACYIQDRWHELPAKPSQEDELKLVEDFLTTARMALERLGDEIKAQARIGFAREVRVWWYEEKEDWFAAVHMHDGRSVRAPLSKFKVMPGQVAFSDLEHAVRELAFAHGADARHDDIELDEAQRSACWSDKTQQPWT